MKHHIPRSALVAFLASAVSGAAALAQVPASSAVGASPAVNASVALNHGGNPAGAMGAAALNRGVVPNSAPLIVGNAGTVGVNGATGSAASATAVHGNDVLATVPGTESIGMRRERFRSLSHPPMAAVSLSETNAAPPADLVLGTGVATDAIRSVSIDTRNQLGTQITRNIEAGRRALAQAEAQARDLDPDARAEFDDAARAARAAERRLQSSLRAAQSAAYGEWDLARDALASDYDTYTQAVAHAQRIAATGAARSTTSFDRR